MKSITKESELLGYDLLCSHPEVFHFVTTRNGGCSVGNYSALNCSPYSGDNLGRVRQNQRTLIDFFPQPPTELIIPYQVHDVKIGVIDERYPDLRDSGKELYLHAVDALITNLPGYCICVSTADCVPVLLFDPVQKVIAAVHAGWRGSVSRIVVQTISEMVTTYNTRPEDILACIGPSISQKHFEVGEEVWQQFKQEGFDIPAVVSKNEDTDKWHIDLWEVNRLQLTSMGVAPQNVEIAGICTYENNEEFFSARRLGTQSGRILSGIMINMPDV